MTTTEQLDALDARLARVQDQLADTKAEWLREDMERTLTAAANVARQIQRENPCPRRLYWAERLERAAGELLLPSIVTENVNVRIAE